MTSLTTEPPTLRSIPSIAAAVTSSSGVAASNRRSYSCYNCNYSFHITPTANVSPSSPSSFRCPRCHHRHLIPHHTIYPSSPPSTAAAALPMHNSDSNSFVYQTSDDSDSEDDYDSDNSLLSFTTPTFHQSTPALKSLVGSLPIKKFPLNSTPSLQSCSICMEDFDINPDSCVTVNELPCNHYFHKDCIVEWLQMSNTCPLCRYKLPADPAAEEGIDPGTNRWEVEYGAVLVVDLAPIREPDDREGVDREESLSSNAASPGSDSVRSSVNAGDISRWDLDAMRDEDGDTLMVDA